MKKTMLYGAILNLICAQVQAIQVPAPPIQVPAPSAEKKGTVIKKVAGLEATKNKQSEVKEQAIQLSDSLASEKELSAKLNLAKTINCEYKIPIEITKIDEALVLSWAEYAATQSFDFNSVLIDNQLQKLQACYTENGWIQFKTALTKSGNLEVIRTQDLAVSSQLDGLCELIESKDYQWKINIPLKVVYQNDKERVTHFLSIYLTIVRKITGELGIRQMIATPRSAPLSQKSESVQAAIHNISSFIGRGVHQFIQFASFEAPQRPINKANKESYKILAETTKIAQVVVLNSLKESAQSQSIEPKPIEPINCYYKIPVEVNPIDKSLILNWAKYAVIQSFEFNADILGSQLEKLQACYTEKGWSDFTAAMQKSGNIDAIKSFKLTMNSQLNGSPQLLEAKDNQWKIALPLKVIYKNDKNEATQLLDIELIVDRKTAGTLGIRQIIAKMANAS